MVRRVPREVRRPPARAIAHVAAPVLRAEQLVPIWAKFGARPRAPGRGIVALGISSSRPAAAPRPPGGRAIQLAPRDAVRLSSSRPAAAPRPRGGAASPLTIPARPPDVVNVVRVKKPWSQPDTRCRTTRPSNGSSRSSRSAMYASNKGAPAAASADRCLAPLDSSFKARRRTASSQRPFISSLMASHRAREGVSTHEDPKGGERSPAFFVAVLPRRGAARDAPRRARRPFFRAGGASRRCRGGRNAPTRAKKETRRPFSRAGSASRRRAAAEIRRKKRHWLAQFGTSRNEYGSGWAAALRRGMLLNRFPVLLAELVRPANRPKLVPARQAAMGGAWGRFQPA